MHLFTLTIRTNFFTEKYDNEILENCALEIFKAFKSIMDNEYSYKFDYEVFWRKGCVITDIVVSSDHKELMDIFIKNKHDFKNDSNYLDFLKELEKKLENLPPDLQVKNLYFNLQDYRISRFHFDYRGNRIELNNVIFNNN